MLFLLTLRMSCVPKPRAMAHPHPLSMRDSQPFRHGEPRRNINIHSTERLCRLFRYANIDYMAG